MALVVFLPGAGEPAFFSATVFAAGFFAAGFLTAAFSGLAAAGFFTAGEEAFLFTSFFTTALPPALFSAMPQALPVVSVLAFFFSGFAGLFRYGRHAYYGVHGSADFVAHIRKEIAFRQACALGALFFPQIDGVLEFYKHGYAYAAKYEAERDIKMLNLISLKNPDNRQLNEALIVLVQNMLVVIMQRIQGDQQNQVCGKHSPAGSAFEQQAYNDRPKDKIQHHAAGNPLVCDKKIWQKKDGIGYDKDR